MAGLKLGWSTESINSLKQQLAEQIDRIKEQRVVLGVDIDKDKTINQLKGLISSLDNISKSNNPSIDLQVNTVKAKKDLANIKGDFIKVVKQLSQLGEINISPKFDDQGKMSGFTAKLEQLNGFVEKIKYTMGSMDSGETIFNPESIVETNNLDKVSEKLSDFQNKYTSALEKLKNGNVSNTNDSDIKKLQKDIDSLNINNFEEKANQIKNTYSSLSQSVKEYEANLKAVQSSQSFLDSQTSRLNNIKSTYGGKLDINSDQYKQLEGTYNAISSSIQKAREANEALSNSQKEGLKQNISDLNTEQSRIVSITNIIKQQESAIDALKTKFRNVIPDSEINKLKSQLQGLYTSTNRQDFLSSFNNQLDQAEKAATEARRIQGMGSSLGSLSGAGLNISSDISSVQRWAKENIGAKASVTSLSESVDKLGNKIKTASVSVDEGKNIVSKYKITLDENSDSIYKMSTGVQDLSSKHATLGERLSNSIAGFLRFSVVMGGAYAVINQIKQGIDVINELNQSITNIAMVTGDSISTVQKYIDQYTQLSEQLHTTTTDVATAAEEFLRAGNSQSESMKMVQASTVISKEAGISQQEAAQGLIAVANSYNILPEKIMSVVDAMTTVDNKSATSVSEINTALQKTSSSAKEAEVPLQDLISYIAQISSTTRLSSSSIGAGLNSIFSRFQSIKMGKDYDPDNQPLNNVEKSLNSVGISIRKNKDEFKSFSDVIDEVGKHWSTYTGVQKNLISTQLAG